jgi:mRNA-degrading endonuclease HigB of HigAB toxin-antitoxin module
MDILGKEKLLKYAARHSEIRKPMMVWIKVVESARWSNYEESQRTIDCDRVKGSDNLCICNVAHNKCRVILLMSFAVNVMIIQNIENHDQYDLSNKKRSKKSN